MVFTTRNCYYLRISKSTVLPIYVYLDERHVNWMSDTVLQHVLSDLRPKILPKLKEEVELVITGASSTKKPTVDTHRGESYQFCYFLRRTEPHSVIVKTQTFSAAPPRPPNEPKPPTGSGGKKGKRKAVASNSRPNRSKRARKSNQIIVDSSDEEGEIAMTVDDDDDFQPPDDNDDATTDAIMSLEIEEEEAKPKPILGLKYQGYNIYGSCLCIVVEPWPVVRAMTGVAAALAKMPTKSSTNSQSRNTQDDASKQPLFLPEEAEEVVDEAPESTVKRYVNRSYLKQVLDNEVIELSDDSDNEEDGGMMAFTQVLRNVGDTRAGAMNDDEDMDGSILFGDADEHREL